MTGEQAIFIGVLALLLVLALSVWRASWVTHEEFFPSQRARVLSRMRLRAGALFAVAAVAVSVQFVVGQERLEALERKEQRLLQYKSDLVRLRVDFELERKKTLPVAQAAVPEAPIVAPELALVSVPRAVVRDRPAGRPQFTLTSGARVQLRGAPADGSGRRWREAVTDDGRHGWIAAEVLTPVKS